MYANEVCQQQTSQSGHEKTRSSLAGVKHRFTCRGHQIAGVSGCAATTSYQ